MERSLYNGVIPGISLDGTLFFYPTPLECNMEYHFNSGHTLSHQPWVECSCCPSNMCRFMPSVPGYIYAQKDNDIYVNLFVQSATEVELKNQKITISQETNYPWDGKIKITIDPKKSADFTIKLRIPCWTYNQPVPGDLYSYVGSNETAASIKINGKVYSVYPDKGLR